MIEVINYVLVKRILSMGLSFTLLGNISLTPLKLEWFNKKSYQNSLAVKTQTDSKKVTAIEKNIIIDDPIVLSRLTSIEQLPSAYKEQLLDKGYTLDTRLDSLKDISLDVVDGYSLTWLNFCSALESLQLNFLDKPSMENCVFVYSLNHLTNLTITCLKTDYYEDYQTWENDRIALTATPFMKLYDSGYEATTKRYYHSLVTDVDISEFMYAFSTSCPNVTDISINCLSYETKTDLSWLAQCRELTSLYIRPFFEDDWNLDRQLPSILESLGKLETLTIHTNSALMNEDDSHLLNTICQLPIQNVTYTGLYNTSFHFETNDGKKIMQIGIGDRPNWESLSNIDTIDFSRAGIYYAIIYLDEATYRDLKAQGIEITFGQNYTEKDYLNIVHQLDKIHETIAFQKGASEQVRLNCILKYIFETYRYGPTDKSIDITNTYYKDGIIYGALNSKEIVCGNYTALLCALLEREGIEAYYIRNSVHAWALVKIDGAYFYTDATYMDSMYDERIKNGCSPLVALTHALESDVYLMDPSSIVTKTSGLEFEKTYYATKIPYWLDAYDEIYKMTTTETRITLDF